jgi:toxin ParE1/3/4
MKIVVSDKAKSDLLRVYMYLAPRNLAAADALIERIDRRFVQLLRFPFIGRPRPSLAPGLRSLVVGNYLIFYSVEKDRITIVRVLDSRMDIDEEFRR